MSVYSVSYDLRKPGRNYEALYKALESYSHCHMMESFWLLDSKKSASEIRKDLGQHIDSSDQLIVIELKKHWAAENKDRCTDWLKSSSRTW